MDATQTENPVLTELSSKMTPLVDSAAVEMKKIAQVMNAKSLEQDKKDKPFPWDLGLDMEENQIGNIGVDFNLTDPTPFQKIKDEYPDLVGVLFRPAGTERSIPSMEGTFLTAIKFHRVTWPTAGESLTFKFQLRDNTPGETLGKYYGGGEYFLQVEESGQSLNGGVRGRVDMFSTNAVPEAEKFLTALENASLLVSNISQSDQVKTMNNTFINSKASISKASATYS